MSTSVSLRLEPLDVLFFRDGRPFTAASRGSSGLPLPQTLAGALRSALLEKYGCNFSKLRDAPTFEAGLQQAGAPVWIASVGCRGPWFARKSKYRSDELEVLVPAPATLHAPKKQKDGPLCRLAPLPSGRTLPGWQPPKSHPELRPLWLRLRLATESAQGYLTPAGLQAFLQNGALEAAQIVKSESLFGYDHRTGIGIEPDRLSAQESQIYGVSFLVLQDSVSFYVEVVLPEDAPHDALSDISTLAFGGEGRRVRVHMSKRFNWPKVQTNDKQILLLTTPAWFRDGWYPSRLTPANLIAAAVPNPQAFSGWDLARSGPKRTRFATPAGSVYYLGGAANNLSTQSLSDDPEDALQGWGCYLRGVWSDA